MKNNFVFQYDTGTIELSVGFPWMEVQPGEGELEIENQGRLRIFKTVSTQGTGAIGQLKCRHNASKRPVQDAHDSLTFLPNFFSYLSSEGASEHRKH